MIIEYKLFWSPEAEKKYLKIITYIIDNWSFEIAEEFEKLVDNLLVKLKQHKNLCPASVKNRKFRKCVVSKQTSLIYRIKENEIELVTFIDNRSNHKY